MAPKTTLTTLKHLKKQGAPIAMLTCYDFATAVLLQQAPVDCLLVGDSLAQVVLGHPTTLPATMDIMVALTAAVRRGAPDVYLIGDMPFLSYQVSTEQALLNAGRFLTEAGCDAVKLEVDHRHLPLIAALAAASIPVMAHLGFRPQATHQFGDVHTYARSASQAWQLLQDAQAMIQAGTSSLLLECVPDIVAQAVTLRSPLPVISCGSGPYCDGQVMVLHDLLALPGATAARFAKSYAPIGDQIRAAAAAYVDDIRQKRFPDEDHSYHMNPEERRHFEQLLRDHPPSPPTPAD